MNAHTIANQALDQGKGILRLAPTWVPRAFCIPGRRLKLDPRDLYAFGANRGGIDERWFASTTPADNGRCGRRAPEHAHRRAALVQVRALADVCQVL